MGKTPSLGQDFAILLTFLCFPAGLEACEIPASAFSRSVGEGFCGQRLRAGTRGTGVPCAGLRGSAAAGGDRGSNFTPAQAGMYFARRYLGRRRAVTNVRRVISFLFAFINGARVAWDVLRGNGASGEGRLMAKPFLNENLKLF